MPDITCYLLRMTGGSAATLNEPIDPDDLEAWNQVGPIEFAGTRTKLFIGPSHPHPPDWQSALKGVFGDSADVPPVSGAGALMVVERKRQGKHFYVALTFGSGWRILRPDSFVRGFGLKTALNIVFEGDTGTGEWDPARLRSVDSKRVGANILRARHQVSGVAALEDLDVNIRRDLVNGVTGVPTSRSHWGSRVTGRDALHFARPNLDNLGSLCDQILDSLARDDYTHRFDFIDHFVGVSDPVTRTKLEFEIIASLEAGDTSKLDLAPPELVDWEHIGGFQYHTERLGKRTNRHEMRLGDYLKTLTKKDRLQGLSVDKLKTWSIWAVDGNGEDVTRWSVWRCLFGEVELDSQTFIVDDGDFYQVSDDYLAALDKELAELPECTRDLIGWKPGWKEDQYNQELSSGSSDLLLLDRKTVRVGSHTNQVEVCDVLSVDGLFIHVKRRGDGSASLSHLFNQGFVSADLAIGSQEFRKVALEKIRAQELARSTSTGDDSFLGKFQPFEESAAIASKCEVVFGIHPEPGKGGVQLLPFFSKVTLRNMVDELHRRGFRVSIKEIAAA